MSEIAQIEQLGPQGMVTLRGDLSDAKLKKAVKAATGHAVPKQRQIAGDLAGGVAWMSPDEVMLFCAHAEADAVARQLAKDLAGTHHLAVNVSDARAVFTIKGAAREVLAKLAPVDMAPGRFEPGELRRTRLAQVAAAFWLADPGVAHVICFRSVGQYMRDLLQDATGVSLDMAGWD